MVSQVCMCLVTAAMITQKRDRVYGEWSAELEEPGNKAAGYKGAYTSRLEQTQREFAVT